MEFQSGEHYPNHHRYFIMNDIKYNYLSLGFEHSDTDQSALVSLGELLACFKKLRHLHKSSPSRWKMGQNVEQENNILAAPT